jgi:hypothetical protein
MLIAALELHHERGTIEDPLSASSSQQREIKTAKDLNVFLDSIETIESFQTLEMSPDPRPLNITIVWNHLVNGSNSYIT